MLSVPGLIVLPVIIFADGSGGATSFCELRLHRCVTSSLLVSLLVYLPWWYRINRELRDLDLSYRSQKPSSRPLGRLLRILAGCLVVALPFMAVFRTGRHIQRVAGKIRSASDRSIALDPCTRAVVCHPRAVCLPAARVEQGLGGRGRATRSWAHRHSTEANRVTGTLPWLKAKRPNHRTGKCVPPLGDDFGPCVDHPVSQVKPLMKRAKKGRGGRGMAIAGHWCFRPMGVLLVAGIAVYLVFVRGTLSLTAVEGRRLRRRDPGPHRAHGQDRWLRPAARRRGFCGADDARGGYYRGRPRSRSTRKCGPSWPPIRPTR